MFRVGNCKNNCRFHNGCAVPGCLIVQCKYDYEYDGNECLYCYSKIKPEIKKIEELQNLIEEKLKSRWNIL